MEFFVTRRRILKTALLWLGAGGLAACSAPPTALAQLEQAEQQWAKKQVSQYRLEVLVVNSVWSAQSHTLTVRNNAAVESGARCIPAPTQGGKCEVKPFTPETYWVPGLFARARSVLQGEQAQWIKVTYDPTYAYPSQISYNNPKIIDGDWAWRVTLFEVLP